MASEWPIWPSPRVTIEFFDFNKHPKVWELTCQNLPETSSLFLYYSFVFVSTTGHVSLTTYRVNMVQYLGWPAVSVRVNSLPKAPEMWPSERHACWYLISKDVTKLRTLFLDPRGIQTLRICLVYNPHHEVEKKFEFLIDLKLYQFLIRNIVRNHFLAKKSMLEIGSCWKWIHVGF